MTKLTKILLLISFATMAQNSFAGSATWNLSPTSGDWNTAANWIPATVPNGKTDIATFGVSNTTDISPSDKAFVAGIDFTAGASAFTVTIIPQRTLTISGVGIRNKSGVVQSFVNSTANNEVGTVAFTGTASAGSMTSFTNNSTAGHNGHGGYITFQDTASAESATFRNLAAYAAGKIEFFGSSSADHATFVNDGIDNQSLGGTVNFFDNSSAGYGTFVNSGGLYGLVGGHGGFVQFYAGSSADHGTFICEGSQVANAGGGVVWLYEGSTAGEATFTAEGGSIADANGGVIYLSSDSGNATFIANGGQVSGAAGGYISGTGTTGGGTFIINGATVSGAFGGTLIVFSGQSSATLIANGGSNGGTGGEIDSYADAIEGKVKVFGNGWLNFASKGTRSYTVGSIEGSGRISLGRHNVSTGGNNLSTAFSGLIEDGDIGPGGSLTKTGTGNLTLTGKNTYTGGTFVEAGILLANNTRGSGTGKGTVQVNGGTFGGNGTISGNVIVGTGSGVGAILGPGARGVTPGTLTIKRDLTLRTDATYKVTLDSSTPAADAVRANGVNIDGAQILFDDRSNSGLPLGTTFTVIDNTAGTPIAGTFANLADGSTVVIGNNTFQANYEGGDGNDLTLTVASN